MSRHGRPHNAEDGVTLVELMVTITIFTIVGGLVLNAFLSLNESVAIADDVTYDQGLGRNALTLVSRDVRAAAPIQQSSAPAFRTAQVDEVEFTALLDEDAVRPQLVNIQVDAQNRLVVTATPPTASSVAPDLVYDAADERERYIASFVVNENDELFTFRDENEVVLDDFDGDGNLDDEDRGNIATVEILLQINRIDDEAGATELAMTVRLPNAGSN